MTNWFDRSRKRKHELALGTDADLVRKNYKRYKIAFVLVGFGCFLSWLSAKIPTTDTPLLIVQGLAVVSLIAGFLLALWARQEAAFLTKPDPKKPPTMSEP
jgi:hypothetical protein